MTARREPEPNTDMVSVNNNQMALTHAVFSTTGTRAIFQGAKGVCSNHCPQPLAGDIKSPS